MKTRRVIMTSALASVAVLGSASSALAFDSTIYHWKDYGYVTPFHWYVEACDNEADGHGVRTEYHTSLGNKFSIGDSNGSKPGCGYEATKDGARVDWFRVCESDDCTAWRPIFREPHA